MWRIFELIIKTPSFMMTGKSIPKVNHHRSFLRPRVHFARFCSSVINTTSIVLFQLCSLFYWEKTCIIDNFIDSSSLDPHHHPAI